MNCLLMMITFSFQTITTVFNVEENTPANTTVGQVRACDPDGAGNNGMTYSLYDGDTQCTLFFVLSKQIPL